MPPASLEVIPTITTMTTTVNLAVVATVRAIATVAVYALECFINSNYCFLAVTVPLESVHVHTL